MEQLPWFRPSGDNEFLASAPDLPITMPDDEYYRLVFAHIRAKHEARLAAKRGE